MTKVTTQSSDGMMNTNRKTKWFRATASKVYIRIEIWYTYHCIVVSKQHVSNVILKKRDLY